jgi:hypothetical protein
MTQGMHFSKRSQWLCKNSPRSWVTSNAARSSLGRIPCPRIVNRFWLTVVPWIYTVLSEKDIDMGSRSSSWAEVMEMKSLSWIMWMQFHCTFAFSEVRPHIAVSCARCRRHIETTVEAEFQFLPVFVLLILSTEMKFSVSWHSSFSVVIGNLWRLFLWGTLNLGVFQQNFFRHLLV